jgi:hypothetical protein
MKHDLLHLFRKFWKITLALLIIFSFFKFTDNANAASKDKFRLNPKMNKAALEDTTYLKYPFRTSYDIQLVNPDSLAKADIVLQTQNPTMQYLQFGNFHMLDTVNIVGVVVIPWGVINYTAGGWTMIIADTGYYSNPTKFNGPWGSMFLRVTITPGEDTLNHYGNMLNVEVGDVVRVTGHLWEFPLYPAETTTDNNTVTQFVPCSQATIANNFEILDSGYPTPETKKFSSSDVNPFYTGAYPGGTIHFSTGEPWEMRYVELYGWTVKEYVNGARYDLNLVNDAGDMLCTYDWSKWFAFREGYRDLDATWTVPAVGSRIDTLRGIICTASGAQNPRGYRIAPMFYPGPDTMRKDVIFGIDRPKLQSHRRNPVIVPSDSAPRVQVTGIRLQNGFHLKNFYVYVSRNYGPFTQYTMTKDAGIDTIIATYTIPKLASGNVRYFFKASDDSGNASIYANTHSTFSGDTSKGFFFYNIINGSVTIHDVQYTPYLTGLSPYVGAVISLTGTVTADSSDLRYSRIDSAGVTCWYMQSGNAPWSGIWLSAPQESIMAAVRKGDSIRVTGTVDEYYNYTRLYNIQYPIEIIATGRPIPEPVSLPDTMLSRNLPDGTPYAEQWESMLVKFDSVSILTDDPYPWFTSDQYEYVVNNISPNGVLVRTDGKNNFSTYLPNADLYGKYILKTGDKIKPLVGVVNFSYSKYRVTPRTDDDIGIGTIYTFNAGWNLTSVPFVPWSSLKVSLFPEAVSNAFAYDNGYFPKDTILNGVGYWLKFPSTINKKMLGQSNITNQVVDVKSGWNLIGSITDPVATSAVTSTPTGIISSAFYAYSAGYTIATSINPTKAYWVKVKSDGQLTLGSGPGMAKDEAVQFANADNFNTIKITDRNGLSQTLYFGLDENQQVHLSYYEMPPQPPSTIFDVRFSTQRMLETYPKTIDKLMERVVNINSAEFPISISWKISNGSGKNFSITDAFNGKIIGVKEIKGEGSIKVADKNLTSLTLKIENGEELPTEFALGQNYPNPFNPTTKMTIALPKIAQVEMVVYNILGQKVKTLVNEIRPAGYHTIEWNGKNDNGNVVPSGVYFIRMVSDTYTKVNKVLMLK